MIIAENLRKSNRAEYLIYMWQVEDILRAYSLDIDKIRKEYLSHFNLKSEDMAATDAWYSDLCRMMQEEGLREKGHLQINKNTLSELEELHGSLMKSQKFPYYREMYYRVLTYIVELRSKSDSKETSELETCFNALYGTLMLRLQKKKISHETQKATQDISTMLGQLSDYFFKNKTEPIDF